MPLLAVFHVICDSTSFLFLQEDPKEWTAGPEALERPLLRGQQGGGPQFQYPGQPVGALLPAHPAYYAPNPSHHGGAVAAYAGYVPYGLQQTYAPPAWSNAVVKRTFVPTPALVSQRKDIRGRNEVIGQGFQGFYWWVCCTYWVPIKGLSTDMLHSGKSNSGTASACYQYNWPQ